jgi:hypothetical protein
MEFLRSTGRQRLISGVLQRTSEARRFGGAEPGSRVPKIEGRVARHDLRKMSIGEHYAGWITLMLSEISRISGGTVIC